MNLMPCQTQPSGQRCCTSHPYAMSTRYITVPTPVPVPNGSASAEAVLLLQVRAPVLLMLGEDDRRVPPKQGLEYYRALKARGVPTR